MQTSSILKEYNKIIFQHLSNRENEPELDANDYKNKIETSHRKKNSLEIEIR